MKRFSSISPDSVTYSLTGSGSTDFTIGSSSGVVTLSQALDYETRPSYALTVAASDGKGGLVTTSLTVTVTNQNDSPKSLHSSYSASIAENLNSGTKVLQTSATDEDGNTVTYSLSGSAHFQISNTGMISTSIPLNYETKNSYSLTVTFSDGPLSDSKAVSITVNDENDTPTFPGSPYTASVAEDAAVGSTVYDVDASDEDGDSLVYSLSGAGATYFGINWQTGVVTIAAGLNYEEDASHSLSGDFSSIHLVSSNNCLKGCLTHNS